jgi:alanine dehydrogenase
METRIITQKEIERVLRPPEAIKAVRKAFKAYALGKAEMPPKSYLTFPHGDLRTMPAYLHGEGFNMAGVKSVNVHPRNSKHQLPTVMAVIVLTDPKTGFPVAIMDGTYLTNLRTGAAGAVAAQSLGNKASKVVGFVGAGVQARTQLACLMEVFPVEEIRVWQRMKKGDPACPFCTWAAETYNIDTVLSAELNEVTRECDILVTTTPSRKPLVAQVSPGTHINAIGADALGKQEIHASVMRQARIVVDDWAQASHSGEINVPIRSRQIRKKDIYGELGDIVAGKLKGREGGEEITLFDSTGLAIQDIACASVVFKALKGNPKSKTIRLFSKP